MGSLAGMALRLTDGLEHEAGRRWSAGGDAVSERSGARSTTQLQDNLVKLLHNANGTLSY